MTPFVIAVSSSPQHTFSKPNRKSITLIKGIGVEGDAHAGKNVKHRFLAKKDPTRPNIRQVHLIHAELFDELKEKEFIVNPGELGENITTQGVPLLDLPKGTRLQIGTKVMIEITALRNPCVQIDEFQPGLLKEVLLRDKEGHIIRKTGVMGIVLAGGEIRPNDAIKVFLPPEPHYPLEYVW
jgi:MOSC domain-containing protein YiiM